VQITQIYGNLGRAGTDNGDMLGYSAAPADVDGDGLMDLVLNEMAGNGLAPDARDTGNFILLSGVALASERPDCAGIAAGRTRFDRCGVCGGRDVGQTPPQGCVSFSQQVWPTLAAECTQCHGGAGGLSLLGYDLLMSGSSNNGPVVLPGRSGDSLLVQKLNGTQLIGQSMPPGLPLQTEDIAVIQDWIDEGARDN
jgi:hypothetical protein